MKRLTIKTIFSLAALLLFMSACTKTEVPVENELTPDNFPKTDQQYILATGPVYAKFRTSFATSYWFLQTLSTDEAILPSRNGGWYDGGRYQQLHYHTWTPDNPAVADTWSWGFGTISLCNQVLTLFSSAPESPSKAPAVAEIRTMRALSLYFMMDLFGNIPIPTSFGDTALPAQKNRKEAFAFIEKEIKEVLPALSANTGISTYGRPNKYTAWALLAKMYLNAPVYTGENKYNEAVAACDSIIKSGKYTLADDYAKMFYPDNGPTTPEFIFAIPYDRASATGESFSWYSLHPALQTKYGLAYRLSNPVSTLPEYFTQFSVAGDVRNNVWLSGKQYDFSGNPILITTTKSGLDAGYTGSDAGTTVQYHLEFTPNVTLRDAAKFEVGGDELGKAKGFRNNKYYPDVTATDRNQSNDVPVFRYAEILLIKAEAELRGASVSNSETPDVLINRLRAKRNAGTVSGIDEEELLRERARELNWECTRRTDLIRYGKYEGRWGYKTDNNALLRLYPIPSAERILNPKLNQNQGY